MKVVIKGARIAFPDLFTPKEIGDGEPRCGASFILDPKAQASEVQKLVDAITQVSTEKWGVKADAILTAVKAKGDICLQSGNAKAEYEGFAGNVFVSASNPTRPVVLDKDKSPLTQADGRPYSGCYVNVSLDVWAQDNKWGKRVNAKLLAVQFERDGEAFAGGAAYDDSDFEGEASSSTGAGDFFS